MDIFMYYLFYAAVYSWVIVVGSLHDLSGEGWFLQPQVLIDPFWFSPKYSADPLGFTTN